MNAESPIRQGFAPKPFKLTGVQFMYLKRSGIFSGYGKTELLNGEMSGVPLLREGEPESDASVPIKLRAQDYLLLHSAGLLADGERTELIDGVLYEMSPQHRQHWYAKNEMTYRLRRALEAQGSKLYVGSEGSVFLSEFDLPEPDIIVTSEPSGPGPIPLASVRLLVEVADTTASYDLGLKAESYAAASVPEYWVADLPAQQLHQHWQPGPDGYAKHRVHAFGKRIESITLPLAIDIPE